LNLAKGLAGGEFNLSDRSITIATYALCGFANFGSLGIMIAAISGMAPSRRHDLARLGIRSIIAGSLAAFLTATIAGILL
jgi:CNT family concentrative nucleoside transporter